MCKAVLSELSGIESSTSSLETREDDTQVLSELSGIESIFLLKKILL